MSQSKEKEERGRFLEIGGKYVEKPLYQPPPPRAAEQDPEADPKMAPPYQPVDTLRLTFNSTIMYGSAGLFIAAVRNALTAQNVGVTGVFTRHGGVIAMWAAAGAAGTFAYCATTNLQEQRVSFTAAGLMGFAAGGTAGYMTRGTLGAAFGHGVGLGAMTAIFLWSGGMFPQFPQTTVEQAEALRKNYKNPVEKTVAFLGEGRGIYPEGYEERRRERLKAKYGLDLEGVPSAH